MNKRICIIILLTTLSISNFAQETAFGSEELTEDFTFCVNLLPNASGDIVHYAMIKHIDNKNRKLVFLTRDEFLFQIGGKMKSDANFKRVNLFRKYSIQDSLVIDNLWKLRYAVYPYNTGNSVMKGWGVNPKNEDLPSPGQMELLKTFGLTRIGDYIEGENLFKLLKAMEDPEWLTKYKQTE
jgi:hypothetical protein